MEYPILFVSLGPGDPELITLKGLKALQSADYIFCPSAISPEGKTISRSADALKQLAIPSQAIRSFHLPMNKNRSLALQAYEEVYEACKLFQSKGKRIVVVVEGDTGLYSPLYYVFDRLKKDEIPVEQIPGIPAFIAAGALAGFPIMTREERLMIVRGMITCEELESYLTHKTVVAIIKLPQCAEVIRPFIKQHPEYTYHYFENVGTGKEYYSSDSEKICKRKYPSFSLMIIK